MKKIACIALSLWISGCSTFPEKNRTLEVDKNIEDISLQIHQLANQCWAKKQEVFGEDGTMVKFTTRSETQKLIRVSRYASDIGVRDPSLIINFTKVNAQRTKIEIVESIWACNVPGISCEYKNFTQDVNNWLNGKTNCSL